MANFGVKVAMFNDFCFHRKLTKQYPRLTHLKSYQPSLKSSSDKKSSRCAVTNTISATSTAVKTKLHVSNTETETRRFH